MSAASLAGRLDVALLLLLLLTLLAAVEAQVIPFNPPKHNVTDCHSITQCYMMQLGTPRSNGEW
jgi:hypothetical protein